ncbi:MAG: sulfatase [Candidatus Binatia bacterium]|nr:sulfatase [Candidatus Binatia bacterium]
MSVRAIAGALVGLALAAPALAAGRARTEPFLVSTTPYELNDDTRPVARDVKRQEDGAARVSVAGVRVPEGAELEAWFALPGESRGTWRVTLSASSESETVESVQIVEESARSGWRRVGMGVASLEQEEVRVELRADPVAGAVGRPVLGAPRFVVRRPEVKVPRNVIVVSLDTLRADRMSSYGAQRETSPQMDALAAAGVRFETALAPASSTPPSHMSMLTGTSPCRHGVWGVHLEDTMSDEIDTLAEILGRDGYATAAITENAYMSPPYGFARGFDSYVELKQMVADRNSPSPGVITPTGYGPKTFRAAGEWLRDNAARQFFLFVHTYQVHGPRRPSGAYAKLFAETPETGVRNPGYDPDFHDLRRYDQLVRQLDDLVGGLAQQIMALGLADETLLVLTSDHGEAFFEHGDHGHGWSVYGEVLRVPLIFWAPGLASPGVVQEPTGLVDLVPTVLDLVGLPVPTGLDGKSRAASVRNSGTASAASQTYYAETAPGNVRAVRTARFKIIRGEDSSDETLFDLRTDGSESAPIALGASALPANLQADAAEIESLRTELDLFAAQCRDQRAAAAARRGTAAELDPVRHEKLKALGYVE